MRGNEAAPGSLVIDVDLEKRVRPDHPRPGEQRVGGSFFSLRIHNRIGEAFGWAKTVAGMRKARHRGLPKVNWQFALAMAAYSQVRLLKPLVVPA